LERKLTLNKTHLNAMKITRVEKKSGVDNATQNKW